MRKNFEDVLKMFNPKNATEMIIGYNSDNNIKTHDMFRDSHIVIGGTVGSGKEVAIQQMVTSIMYKQHPDEVQFVFYDPRLSSYSIYNGSKFNYRENIVSEEDLKKYLEQLKNEKRDRLNKMEKARCENIIDYNEYAKKNDKALMPNIINVFDEINLSVEKNSEIEELIDELMKSSQESGMYFIISEAKINQSAILEKLKRQTVCRIAMKLGEENESKILIGESGAENLPNHGAMLYKDGNGNVMRLQATFIPDEEIKECLV